MRIVGGWAERIDARRASALGFAAETSFDDVVRTHIGDELGGLVAEAIAAGAIPGLCDYGSVRREVKYGRGSRVDFLLEDADRPPCYLEVKNVHLMRRPGLAEFPDSVTARGAKHLDELAAMATAGARAVMLYLIQIGSAERFALARDIDPAYGAAFDRARAHGVEAIAWRCVPSCEQIIVEGPVPMVD